MNKYFKKPDVSNKYFEYIRANREHCSNEVPVCGCRQTCCYGQGLAASRTLQTSKLCWCDGWARSEVRLSAKVRQWKFRILLQPQRILLSEPASSLWCGPPLHVQQDPFNFWRFAKKKVDFHKKNNCACAKASKEKKHTRKVDLLGRKIETSDTHLRENRLKGRRRHLGKHVGTFPLHALAWVEDVVA